MSLHRRIGVLLLLAAAGASTASHSAMTVEEEARALIGTEFTPHRLGEQFAPGKSACTDNGFGNVAIDNVNVDDWADGELSCRGRTVITLSRRVAEKNGVETWRIVDTLLLPPFDREWKSPAPNARMYIHSAEGVCGLTSRPGTSYFTLVRWGKRKRIDWRTGVERAWTFDIEQGRIVPLSTRHIYCEWVDP